MDTLVQSRRRGDCETPGGCRAGTLWTHRPAQERRWGPAPGPQTAAKCPSRISEHHQNQHLQLVPGPQTQLQEEKISYQTAPGGPREYEFRGLWRGRVLLGGQRRGCCAGPGSVWWVMRMSPAARVLVGTRQGGRHPASGRRTRVQPHGALGAGSSGWPGERAGPTSPPGCRGHWPSAACLPSSQGSEIG